LGSTNLTCVQNKFGFMFIKCDFSSQQALKPENIDYNEGLDPNRTLIRNQFDN